MVRINRGQVFIGLALAILGLSGSASVKAWDVDCYSIKNFRVASIGLAHCILIA